MIRFHPGSLVALFVLVLVGPALAGCLGGGPAPQPLDEQPAEVTTYQPVDEDLLSQPVHGIAAAVQTRVIASSDGISLFAEYFLPEGDGPWPTILHSTPYKHLDKAFALVGGNALVEFYVPRGYAVVLADVRGFGDSDGCVEVWGLNEQQDQYDLVEWVAAQPWSDGKVGMQGASYPGTTPLQAAVLAPPHLVTIVAAAGLTDAYFDWHYDGVPNGESSGSPAAYQAIGAAPPIEPLADPLAWMSTAANTGCGIERLHTEAYQLDSVYTQFYKDRNLSARVKDIEASVLYTQGFTDGNVKPTMLLNWFNEIEAPKKGFFGQWAHSWPVRDDYKDFELAWFDHWLKGIDNGVMAGPVAEIMTNRETWRGDSAFPSDKTASVALHLDATDMSLTFDAPQEAGTASWVADRTPSLALPAPLADIVHGLVSEERRLVFTSAPLEEELYLSGVLHLHLRAAMEGENAYLMASLTEIDSDGGRQRITFAGLAAALRDSLEEYKPVPAGEVIDYRLRFQPREWIVDAGSRLEIILYTPDLWASTSAEALMPNPITVHTGPGAASFLDVPVLAGRPDAPYPWED